MSTPQQVVERVLELSTARDTIVLVQARSAANLRWARTTLTTNGETTGLSVTVVAVADVAGGTATGTVTRSSPDADGLAAMVAEAVATARSADPAEDADELVSALVDPDWESPAAVVDAGSVGRLAAGLGDLFAAADADGIEHFGYAEESAVTTYLGTSRGARRRFTQPEGRLELTAKSHHRARSTWAGRAAPSLADIDVPGVDAELRRALGWQARRVDVDPGRHRAVLTPSAVSDLMIDLYWNSVARDAVEGRSVWSRPGGTRIGESVARDDLQLWSDPTTPGMECMPFVAAIASSAASSVFDNGLEVGRTSWVRDGVLQSLINTRAIAAASGMPSTPGVDNLTLTVGAGAGTLDDVVARTDRGLLVTCLWYNRVVDPQTLLLTGLTRDGVYLVEGGEVTAAVGNFRFNDSPVGLLGRITDAGVPERTLAREMGDYFNRAAMPALVVEDFNFSTASQAS